MRLHFVPISFARLGVSLPLGSIQPTDKQFILSIFFWDFDFCVIGCVAKSSFDRFVLFVRPFQLLARFDIWIKHQFSACCAIIFVWFLMRSADWACVCTALRMFIYVIWIWPLRCALFSLVCDLRVRCQICVMFTAHPHSASAHFYFASSLSPSLSLSLSYSVFIPSFLFRSLSLSVWAFSSAHLCPRCD